ncbi:hypothetical protein PR048_022791 [Dryococelus australis]|uniref:Uncharacterized protein n=1 Tax=Dryococelus australis TaxID=614101 RepID=A0ABQ9GS83_9NEOP|nr:hypothetical protein PR048_022791 [Dryococelus australis]
MRRVCSIAVMEDHFNEQKCNFARLGAAVVKRLACSPPTNANRVQSVVGPLPDSRMWESWRTMPLVSGFSRRSHVSLALSFRRCSILTSITLIGSQDLAWLRHLCSRRSEDGDITHINTFPCRTPRYTALTSFDSPHTTRTHKEKRAVDGGQVYTERPPASAERMWKGTLNARRRVLSGCGKGRNLVAERPLPKLPSGGDFLQNGGNKTLSGIPMGTRTAIPGARPLRGGLDCNLHGSRNSSREWVLKTATEMGLLSTISCLLALAVSVTFERNQVMVVSIPHSESVGEHEIVLSPGCAKECSLCYAHSGDVALDVRVSVALSVRSLLCHVASGGRPVRVRGTDDLLTRELSVATGDAVVFHEGIFTNSGCFDYQGMCRSRPWTASEKRSARWERSDQCEENLRLRASAQSPGVNFKVTGIQYGGRVTSQHGGRSAPVPVPDTDGRSAMTLNVVFRSLAMESVVLKMKPFHPVIFHSDVAGKSPVPLVVFSREEWNRLLIMLGFMSPSALSGIHNTATRRRASDVTHNRAMFCRRTPATQTVLPSGMLQGTSQ